MSWSLNAIGKGSAISKAAKATITTFHCSEPEDTMKLKICETIQAACDASPNEGFIVEANGSQYTDVNNIIKATANLKIQCCKFLE